MTSEPPWWDWLRLSATELKRRGARAEERFARIGHRRPLMQHWAQTVGMWCVETAPRIREAAGLSESDADKAAFAVMRSRHGLHTAASYLRRYTAADREENATCITASVASRIYLTMDAYFAGHACSPGEAAAHAAKETGVLPVEAALYYAQVEPIIAAKGCRALTYFKLGLAEFEAELIAAARAGTFVVELPGPVETAYSEA